MDDIRRRFSQQIAARLAAAPDSRAKEELVEELAENLYRRYQDMTDSGLDREEAFRRAMEDLGDVDELLEYLDSLDQGQTRSGVDPFDELIRDVEDIAQNVLFKARDAVREVKRRMRDEDAFTGRAGGARRDPWVRVNVDGSPAWSAGPLDLEGLRGLDIDGINGDVTLLFSQDAGELPRFSGSTDELDVSRTEDGVLVIRQGRTASSSYLFRRGYGGADIVLRLPCRDWEFMHIRTANGDVELSGACTVGSLTVRTACGDVEGRLGRCGRLDLSTASGDIHWRGDGDSVSLESASGDLWLEGAVGDLNASTASGDIELFCPSAQTLRCASLSGDLRVETDQLPQALDLSSKSGDCSLRLPGWEQDSFTLRLKTVSGDIGSRLPLSRVPGGAVCGQGPLTYSVSTVSGDIRLELS